MENREQLINQYITAYNNFDIDGMLASLDANIQFENISDGVVNMTLNGLSAFKAQAEQAMNIFSSRQQTVTQFKHSPVQTEVDIAYHAVLAADQPNGMKRGDELNLNGKSVFKFSNDKIVGITDIS